MSLAPPMTPIPEDLRARMARVGLLAMDVDGVLTDGRITWLADRNGALVEQKSFDVKDGLGFALARAAGLRSAWITGRESPIVRQRAAELGVEVLLQGVRDKGAALGEICAQLGIAPEESAYVGDDLNDLPAFSVAGISIAVADAAPEIRLAADWSTATTGGHGAVREVVETILAANGQRDAAFARFLTALREPEGTYDPLPRR